MPKNTCKVVTLPYLDRAGMGEGGSSASFMDWCVCVCSNKTSLTKRFPWVSRYSMIQLQQHHDKGIVDLFRSRRAKAP